MNTRLPTILAAFVSVLCASAVNPVFAGPLNPPVGPVASTPGPEPRTPINAVNTPGDADSLFKITQPGSYYLTGNITGVAGRHGIEIAASGVTLDLMGFDLSGVPASLDGVSATIFNLTNITIRNGSVRGWGDEGVDLLSFLAVNTAVRDVRASGNAGRGITTGVGSTITGCSASGNTSNGISAGSGSTITGCTAYDNTGNGIAVGSGSTVTGCTARSNSGDGISTSDGSTVTGCTARSNTGNGIAAGLGSTVAGCTARLNTGNGIVAGNGSTVAGCTAASNTGNGIQVDSDCRVTDNTCESNGFGVSSGAGIHATGGDNRIEGNNCVDADRGIDVDAAGNIIIKNTCSGNTINWSIVANNVVGPILDRTAPASAAISGNSAPSSLGTTDANANFSY